MSVKSLVKPAPSRGRRPLSAVEQIDKIASTFSLSAKPNDVHGDDLRQQLLTSYAEWLGMEQRLLTSELWPTAPKGQVVIPVNTRWGDWHFSRPRFPGAGWYNCKHPLERAAFVLWAVGAIDDIPDPMRGALAELKALEDAVNDETSALSEGEYAEATTAIYERLAAGVTPTTMAGAAAGLRFALRGMGDEGESKADIPVVEAVIRFLEREDPTGYVVDPDRSDYRNMDHTEGNIEWWRDEQKKLAALSDDDGVADDDPRLAEAASLELQRWQYLLGYVPTSIEGLKAKFDLLADPDLRDRIDKTDALDVLMDSTIRSLAYLQERAS